MENLSDVEFGSDKGGEEAPILVAQRYLNIFRQVHIFKKEKRDQFDNELLALPSNVTDFFKRMPGGRLLVEHIEEVKTERGIAFVKTSRDEFTDGTEDAPVSTSVSVPAPTQVTGGNLVMDSSFAETFAQSLADAFKQIPVASGNNSAATFISPDIGKSFELIAEEIRTTHSSLLNVLKETRSITDTVIASQVAISKILENLLSSQKREDNETRGLNNRILASQMAITQLLEGLGHNFKQGSFGNLPSDQIETRLFQLKQQIIAEVEQSLLKTRNSISANESEPFAEKENQIFYDNLATETQNKPLVDDTEFLPHQSPVSVDKKKKKKKKKKSNEHLLDVTFSSLPAVDNTDVQQISDSSFSSDLTSFGSAPAIDGIIKNDTYKYDDDFSHIDLNKPPLDIKDDTFAENFSSQSSSLEEVFANSSDDDDLDFVLPEQGSALSADDFNENLLDQNMAEPIVESDGLEFSLPESAIIPENEEIDSSADTLNDLDSFTNSHNFDTSILNDETVDDMPSPSEDTGNEDLDNFTDNHNFDTSILNDETVDDMPSPSENGGDGDLDSFTDNHNFDSSVLDGEIVDDSSVSSGNSGDETLDGLINSNNLDFPLSESNSKDIVADASSYNDEDSLDSLTTMNDHDDFVHEDSLAEELPSAEHTGDENLNTDLNDIHDHYSAELDRIREALTNDNVDISSLDTPIALDDYTDDEHLSAEKNADDDQWEYDYVEDDTADGTPVEEASKEASSPDTANDDDWDWEYVDENGNIVPSKSEDDDWEWEYVEDDDAQQTAQQEDENKE